MTVDSRGDLNKEINAWNGASDEALQKAEKMTKQELREAIEKLNKAMESGGGVMSFDEKQNPNWDENYSLHIVISFAEKALDCVPEEIKNNNLWYEDGWNDCRKEVLKRLGVEG